ncbi:hypothetical protein KPH14_003098 [Odynerus spinipes]|uniref:snRNA-activating protein complex subunit 3 n=1 Tax=Odynerus spinipes TaxID=1348599 RepID=A0AAD9RWW2_9HYME|nr:hypothetical protein KPH14_003098 [Odynerus spinipes]
MDSVYGHYNRFASGKINIKEYFSKYSNLLKSCQFDHSNSTTDNSILQTMKTNLGKDEMSLLTEYCSIENLTVPDELPKVKGPLPVRRKNLNKVSVINEDFGLETLKQLIERNNSAEPYHYRFNSEIFIDYEQVKYDENSGDLAVQGEDILVYVRVYESFTHPSSQMKYRQRTCKPILKCVIEILGKQTLTDLRDKISCVSDLTIPVEVSNNPDQPLQPMAKDVYKSGFFYIEDTFYNDFRDPANLDYSAVIREWAKSRQLGPFYTASMENVRIDSLCVRFGYPWVYQHQGSCEHLIVFSDARLVSSDDDLRVSVYPRISRIRLQRTNYCFMCGILPVQWITTDHDRVPHIPCFFCESCFKSYNYVNGKKVGNFKAYRYPCDSSLIQENEEVT